MYLRRDQTCAVEEILGDLGAVSEGHLGVLHHLDQQLRHLVGRHDQLLGCAATHLRRSTAMEVAHERPVHRFATAPLARLQRAVARRIVGGSCAHLDTLWLRFLPAMISSLLQASEPARQLGDLGSGVVDGLHGAAVRDLDGRDVSGDLPVTLSQPGQRASRSLGTSQIPHRGIVLSN